MLKYLNEIDIDEKDITNDEIKGLSFLPDEIKKKINDSQLKTVELQIRHQKYDADNQQAETVGFELDDEESIGTQKFFALSAPILDTLAKGKILLIDEMDASLHPKLTEALIKLFHDKQYNKKNAQLIFVTHDVHLLSAPKLFEHDQIWFTEKDKYGVTDLYSLIEF